MPPTYFADTFYWIALIFPRDAFHAAVASFSGTLGSARLVTTDEVLSEVLSHFAGLGPLGGPACLMMITGERSRLWPREMPTRILAATVEIERT
jgi:hypothetical protein